MGHAIVTGVAGDFSVRLHGHHRRRRAPRRRPREVVGRHLLAYVVVVEGVAVLSCYLRWNKDGFPKPF